MVYSFPLFTIFNYFPLIMSSPKKSSSRSSPPPRVPPRVPPRSPYVTMGRDKVCGRCGMCGDSYNTLLFKFGHWSNTFSAIDPKDKMCVALYDYDTCHKKKVASCQKNQS